MAFSHQQVRIRVGLAQKVLVGFLEKWRYHTIELLARLKRGGVILLIRLFHTIAFSEAEIGNGVILIVSTISHHESFHEKNERWCESANSAISHH